MSVIRRLIIQLALGAAFGAGQLIFATAASHASLVSAKALVPFSASAFITMAPAGLGWG